MLSPASSAMSTPPPVTLTSLPADVLSQIALLLDSRSAASLARVSRVCASPATSGIWQHLHLALNPRHGEYPLVQPFPSGQNSDFDGWASDVAWAAEERHRTALRLKIKKMNLAADSRKWGMVRHITLGPRIGSAMGMVYTLDQSAKLESLTLDGPAHNKYEESWRAGPDDPLYQQLELLGDNILSLPSLHTLRLRMGSICEVATIVRLLRAMPNVTHLDCDLGNLPVCADFGDAAIPLRTMRLHLSATGRVGLNPIVELMRISWQTLQQLSIKTRALGAVQGSPHALVVERGFISLIRGSPNLRDLHWRAPLESFLDPSDTNYRGGYIALRRVVFEGAHWTRALKNLPMLPRVEVVYFIDHIPLEISAISAPPLLPFSPTQGLLPDLARRIRASPELHTIRALTLPDIDLDFFPQLDKLEQLSESVIGHIRSLVHGEQELISARLRLPFVQVGDIPWHGSESVFTPTGGRCFPYSVPMGWPYGGGRELRAKVFEPRSGEMDEWQELSDYQGKAVPAAVIEEILEAEGMEEWVGRGVEVGAAAWEVLEGWMERERRGEDDGLGAELPTWARD